MRTIFLLIGILFLTIENAHSQSYYYWENEVKNPLELSSQKSYIVTGIQDRRVLAEALNISETKISETDTLIIPKSLQNGTK